MTSLSAFRLVAGREVRESVRRRGFRILIGLLFLAALAAVILPEIIGGGGRPSFDVAIESSRFDELSASLGALAERLDVEIDVTRFAGEDPRAPVDDGSADAVVVEGSPDTIYVESDVSETLVVALQEGIGSLALRDRLVDAGVDATDVPALLATPPAAFEAVGDDREETRGIAALAAIVLYIALLTVTIQVANSTAVEKSSRVSEVLVAIVRPRVLLFGKVVGVGLVSLIGLLALALPILGRAVVGGDLPARTLPVIGAGLVWFVLGLVLYATLAGALGALVERQEEVGTAMQPLTLALIALFLVAQNAADSTLGTVLAYIPFSSPMVEPSRIALGVTSPVEIVGSLALLGLAIAAVVRFGAVVYRRAVVRTGRRLRLREVVRG